MAELGIRDFEGFNFLSPPGRRGIVSAVETLRLLGALDDERNLTPIGRMMIRFPMLPKHSRMIVEAIHSAPQVLEEVVTAASFLTTNSPYLLPMGLEMEARNAHHSFHDSYGDFLSYLKVYRQYRSARNRQRFCERYYLDREVMDEILSVKSQIEEIISEMGIPVLSGGSVADYLCSIAAGLIQFVCVRAGKWSYRSLTAERIQIHPASVMFRENPQYIVAGEIVRTTRMYARSVSRLKAEWLGRISPLLLRSMVRQGKAAAKTGGKAETRDFTNRVKIGMGIFEIIREKRRKIVLLPWGGLRKALKGMQVPNLPDYKNLRGKILYQGYEILSGARLTTILSLVEKIDPDEGILPAEERRSFRYPDEIRGMVRELDKLIRLCPRKRKSRKLGFLGLYTEEEGSYSLRSARSYHAAVLESMSSLENLSDRLGRKAAVKKKVNAAYNRLSELLD